MERVTGIEPAEAAMATLFSTLENHPHGVWTHMPQKRSKKEALREALLREFQWLENRNLRVGTVFLNPKEIETLSGLAGADFDMLDPSNRRAFMKIDPQPGINWGMLWGAQIRACKAVPENHAAIIPDGMVLADLDGPACICLGLQSG